MQCDVPILLARELRAVSAPRTAGARRARRASAPFGSASGGTGAGVCASVRPFTAPPACHLATPTAAEGAEALTALLANARANGLPPTRLFHGGAGNDDAAGDEEEEDVGGERTGAAGGAPPAVYVRKEHSLRTLCQVHGSREHLAGDELQA